MTVGIWTVCFGKLFDHNLQTSQTSHFCHSVTGGGWGRGRVPVTGSLFTLFRRFKTLSLTCPRNLPTRQSTKHKVG